MGQGMSTVIYYLMYLGAVLVLMLLVLTNVYTVSYLLEFLDKIINAPGLSNFFTNVLPNRTYELVYMLLVLLGLNLLASLLVTVVILITKLIFSRKTEYVHADDYYGISKLLHLPWMVVQSVYDDEEAPPRLNGNGFTMGVWVKGFKWAFAIVWIPEMVALAVSILWGDDNWNAWTLLATKNWYLLPMAGFLLQQVQFFLEGVSEDEAGSTMSPYLGTALPLALTALKYDFPRVYLISSDEHGTYSFNDVLTMSAKEVSRFIGKNMNLKSLIRYQLDEALQQQELSVSVVYDTDYNFLNAMMFWQKYGGTKGSLLHVISPAYALREYFAANYHSKRFDLKNNEFNALIPHYLGTRTSHMLVLLVMLCDKGMTEKELMEKGKEYNWAYDNVNQLLRDCLKTVLDKDEIHSVYECFHFEEEKRFNETLGKFEVQTRVSLIDATRTSSPRCMIPRIPLWCSRFWPPARTHP